MHEIIGGRFGINHESRTTLKISAHFSPSRFGNANFVNSSQHMFQPVIACSLINWKGRMSHPQPRMSTLLLITSGAAKILGQKEKLPLFACLQISGKHRSKDGILLDPGVKNINQSLERWITANQL